MKTAPLLLSALLLASCASEEAKPVSSKQQQQPEKVAVARQSSNAPVPAAKEPEIPQAEKTVRFVPPVIEFVPPAVTDDYVPGVRYSDDPEVASYGNVESNNPGNYWEPDSKESGSPVGIKEETPVNYAEEQAEFPGGIAEMRKYLMSNITIPQSAIDNETEGKCFLKFVVLKTGEISDVVVVRGVPDCRECDQEAKRVVKSMPKWIPARNKGKAVDSYYTLPIAFKL